MPLPLTLLMGDNKNEKTKLENKITPNSTSKRNIIKLSRSTLTAPQIESLLTSTVLEDLNLMLPNFSKH